MVPSEFLPALCDPGFHHNCHFANNLQAYFEQLLVNANPSF